MKPSDRSPTGVIGPSIDHHQCVWMVQPAQRTMYGLFAAKGDTRSKLVGWLQKAPKVVCRPVVLLILLCEELVDTSIRRPMDLHARELRSDTHLLSLVTAETTAPMMDGQNLSQATKSLTSTLEAMAWYISRLGRVEEMLDVLDTFNTLLQSSRPPAPELDAWDVDLTQRMASLKARIKGYRVHAGRMQLQGQAILQTVFCLIGTNDNRLNYQATQASVRIAEDFKRVALLTRKDSTDMRIIAAVTLLFLPGTFVATFFSTSFLDFLGDDRAPRVSGLGMGLYWATTTLLTTVVLVCWLRVSRIQTAKDAVVVSTTS